MAGTVFSDMQIVPEKFTQYVNERTTKKSALVRAGIATPNNLVAQVINGTPQGGNMIQMPFFNPLSGTDDNFGETTLVPTGITTGNERATLLIRQHAWSATDLARVKGGADPMAAIMDLVADWWVEREQAIFLSVLTGLFAPAVAETTQGAGDGTPAGCLVSGHLNDISGESSTAAIIGVDAALDTKQKMGDAYNKLGVVVMHSATYTKLQKQQQIDTQYDSDLKIKIDYYLGYEVIVDDDMPVSSGVYDTFFVGKGAFTRENGAPSGLIGTETDRDKLSAIDYLINRKAFVLHPNGISFVGTPSGAYASNAELAAAANWQVVKDLKNIPIVCLRHKIA